MSMYIEEETVTANTTPNRNPLMKKLARFLPGRLVGQADNQESLRILEPKPSSGSEKTVIRIISSLDVPPPGVEITQGLLGPFIPEPPALVMISGESSAGKTVLGYSQAYHLAEGKEWLGLTPPGPMRVLYVDLESPELVFREHVNKIGRCENLIFIRDLPGLDTKKGRELLLTTCRDFQPDVVFIDPLSMAWPIKDENSNSEAERQMQVMKKLAVTLNCVVVVLWNMGEGVGKEKFRARGATARIDRCDLAINYTEMTENTRNLKIVKSRYGTLNAYLPLRFAGDLGFEIIESSVEIGISSIRALQNQILEILADGPKVRKALIELLGPEDLLDKALHRLVLAGEIFRPKRGTYALPAPPEVPQI